MAEQTRSSNATNISVAEEDSYKTLPATPLWYQYSPFEMGDIGGEPTLVAPMPYREDQSEDFGRRVDVSASGSFQTYTNGLNILRLLQGIFVTDAIEQVSSHPLNGGRAAISALTTSRITIAQGGDEFVVGDIILLTGCTGAAEVNNGRIAVVSGTPTATAITVKNTPFVAATSGLAGATIQKVGVELSSGICSMKVTGTTSFLEVSGAYDFTATHHTFTTGQAIIIGGDAAASRFDSSVNGYARLRQVEAKKLTFDNPSFTPAADTGSGKLIHLYYPTVLKNALTDSARNRRSYTIERTMGEGATSNTSQAQYVIGGAPNTVALSFPLANLVTANFGYMPARPTYEASALKTGTRIPAPSYDDYFNTTDDLVVARVSEISNSLVPSDFFGHVSEFSLEQSNNITLNKAHGVLGGFSVSYGDFTISASVTAFFETVAPLQAIIDNKRAQYHCYYAHNNHGFAIDLPLVSLSGGIPAFSKNQPITVPLSLKGAKSDSIGAGFGHVMLFSYFPYVPTIHEGKAS